MCFRWVYETETKGKVNYNDSFRDWQIDMISIPLHSLRFPAHNRTMITMKHSDKEKLTTVTVSVTSLWWHRWRRQLWQQWQHWWIMIFTVVHRTWATFSVTLCRMVWVGRKTPCFEDETALWVSFSADDFFTGMSPMFVRECESSESLDAWLSVCDWWWFPVAMKKEKLL